MKNKLSIPAMITFFFVSVIFISYGMQNDKWKGTIDEENGVKVIKNPNEPLYGEITFELEEDLSIGNEEDENYAFFGGAIPEVDSEGNIFVLDDGNYRIQKFDKDGNYLSSFGRKGQGPGEFQGFSQNFCLDINNKIHVRDRGRIHTFSDIGELINTITFGRSERHISEQFRITKEGNILGKTSSRGELSIDEFMKRYFNIDLLNSKGNLVKTIVTYRSEEGTPLKVMSKMWYTPSSQHTSRLYFCPVDEELSVYGHGSEYKLTLINLSGETVRIIQKDVTAQPVTKEDRDRVLNWFMERQKNNTRWEQKFSRGEVEKAMKFPKYKPFFDGIIRDDKGRIYVKRFSLMSDYEKDKNNYYDLYNKDGYYLYKVVIPIRWVLIIRHGCIYTTEYDREMGYAKVKRYKIKNWDEIKEWI